MGLNMASYDASTLIGMYTAGQDRRNAEIDRRYALEDRARKIKAEEERKALLKDLLRVADSLRPHSQPRPHRA